MRDSPTTLKLDVAKGAIDLANLPDLEPMDVWIDLVHNRGIGPAKVSRPAGRLLLRLTYKSYVDDDDEGGFWVRVWFGVWALSVVSVGFGRRHDFELHFGLEVSEGGWGV